MRLTWPALCCLAACAHSDPFGPEVDRLDGPLDGRVPIVLTYNTNFDADPAFSQDGKSVLYLFAEPAGTRDHCLSALPVTGGTRLWTFCDDDPARRDLAKTFAAYALGDDGRLIYLEATSLRGTVAPTDTRLWLADSAFPLARRPLVQFPAPDSGLTWMGDLQWTGPATFTAMGQHLAVERPCPNCKYDTTTTNVGVFRGAITAARTTLTQIAGTASATSYALAAGGETIVFGRGAQLFKVPIAGGEPALVGTLPAVAGTGAIAGALTGGVRGVVCGATTCGAIASYATGVGTVQFFHRFPLAGGQATQVTLSTTSISGVASSTGGSMVLTGSTLAGRNLFLYAGLLP